MNVISLNVKGMMCEGCENRVKNALKMMEEVEDVKANHETGIVEISLKKDIELMKLEEIIEDIGYEIVK